MYLAFWLLHSYAPFVVLTIHFNTGISFMTDDVSSGPTQLDVKPLEYLSAISLFKIGVRRNFGFGSCNQIGTGNLKL